MEEARLIGRASQGDAAAFNALMGMHERRMYAVALRMCGNAEDAQDCLQEAMLRVYRAISGFKAQSSFSTWLYRITMNTCLDELRKRKNRPSTSLDSLLDAGWSPTDEGETPEALLADPELLAFLSGGVAKWEDYQSVQFNFTVPKFDVVSDIDLLPGLAALGVTDALDPAAADFSPVVKQSASSPGLPVWVGKASHAARVMVDEEGCVAAAYTVIGASGGSMPPDETVDFTLDRPVLFVISGRDSLPLFVGIVNNPRAS